MTRADRSVALVTGAAQGLGAAIARALAGEHAVAVNDLPGSAAGAAVAARIRETGGTAEFFGADVTDENAVRDLVVRVEDRLGTIDVLVVNASGSQPVRAIEDLTWADLLDPLTYFVKSPTLLVQAVLPGMRRRRRGRVINIGSDMPERGLPGQSAYSAAKAAQLALTRVWARELGPDGITVNLVAPGWIPVERHADASLADLQHYQDGVPLGRLGTPDEVADVVGFLAADRSAFVTGQRIAVNGGHTLP